MKHEMTRKEIGDALLKYRKHHKLTHYQMVDLIGCHVNTYRLWERGMSSPGLEFLPKVMEIINSINNLWK